MSKSFKLLIISLLIFNLTSVAQETQLAENLQKHVSILASDSMGGRGWGYPEKYKARDYIVSEFVKAGFVAPGKSYFDEFIHFGYLTMNMGYNVIGIIEGSDPELKNEYIVLGAHYDHMGWKVEDGDTVVYNGADDNASGVAAIIEAGKILLKNKDKLKRSIVIAAFDAEEAGLVGSAAFVADSVIKISDVKMMFSIDMVGMYVKNKGVDINGAGTVKGGKELAEEVALNEGVTAKVTDKISRNTDSWSFAEAGIPAASFNTGLLSPYHKPEDDYDLLDYDGMAQVTALLAALTEKLSTAAELVPELKLPEAGKKVVSKIGLRIDYGWSQHRYTDMFYTAKPVFAFEAGLVSSIRIGNKISIQPGVSYEYHGSNTPDGKFHFHSVSPNADILFLTPAIEPAPIRFYLLGGAYWRYNFGATAKWKSYDYTPYWNQSDYGLKAGFGFDYGVTQVGFYTKYGLDDIRVTPVPGDRVRSRMTSISVIAFF